MAAVRVTARGLPSSPRRSWFSELGVALVETAVVLPIFLLIVFGLVEMGRLFQTYSTVQHAAREGARFAITGRDDIVSGNRLESIKEVAEERAVGLPGDVTVAVRSFEDSADTTPTENDAGDACQLVEVEVEYDFTFVVPLISALVPDLTLHGTETMVNEPFAVCDSS